MAKPKNQGTDFKPHAGVQRARQLWYDSLDRAEQGDPRFAKLVFERLFPTLKPVEPPLSYKIPNADSLTVEQKLDLLVSAMLSGEASASEVERVLSTIHKIAEVKKVLFLEDQIDELVKRLESVENGIK